MKKQTVLSLIALLLLSLFSLAEEPLPVFPPPLRPGDTIAVVAPASDLNRERVERAVGRLEAMGFRVKWASDIYRKRGYLAGTDERRADELMAAFRDPEVKAIFPGTGGYGTTRMIDRLDYETIRRHPKILHGFSDVTGLHLAIQKKTGLVTFHGPNLMYGLGSEGNLTSFSAEYLWRALLERNYFDSQGRPVSPGYSYTAPDDVTPMITISPGVARGRLIGGNLSLISPLIGSEFEIETQGRILFIEDVGEKPYRIDRYLSHLRLAGKLDDVAGVVLGIFRNCEPEDPEDSLSLEQVFRDYFEDLGVPVILNFPIGHFKYNATLPVGVLAELDADRRRLTLLENPVQLAPAIPVDPR